MYEYLTYINCPYYKNIRIENNNLIIEIFGKDKTIKLPYGTWRVLSISFDEIRMYNDDYLVLKTVNDIING